MLRLISKHDRSGSFRRKIKIIRNIFTDPTPRNHELVFESYAVDYPNILYNFSARGRRYTSKVDFGDVTREEFEQIDPETLHRVAVTIGLTLAPFHFVLTDFAKVRVECADFLAPDATAFFERFLRLGLGEFRYRHGLNPVREIELVTNHSAGAVSPPPVQCDDRMLLLNGGGKDTAVMAELSKATGLPLAWCSVNHRRRHDSLSDVSGISDCCSVGFSLDPAIHRDARYKWGHVPYASLFMSASLLAAVGRGFRYVGIGNEYSSNFGNVRFKNTDLNHQYSKTFEYESGFNEYIKKYVAPNLEYFSVLRPFHDFRNAAMLSQMPQYLGTFVSCNQTVGWCGKCSKCAFTFLALQPWLSHDDMLRTFGSDLMQNSEIRTYVLDLTAGRIKPWECVGAQDECKLALALVLRKYPELDYADGPNRRNMESVCEDLAIEPAVDRLVRQSHGPHLIPPELWSRIGPVADRLTQDALGQSGLAI